MASCWLSRWSNLALYRLTVRLLRLVPQKVPDQEIDLPCEQCSIICVQSPTFEPYSPIISSWAISRRLARSNTLIFSMSALTRSRWASAGSTLSSAGISTLV